MPSSLSIDSPTPSRHPEFSGNSLYSSRNVNSQKLQKQTYTEPSFEDASEASLDYPSHHGWAPPQTGHGQHLSNVAVYDDTRGSSQYQRQSSVPIHHPLPRVPGRPAHKLNHYYDIEDNDEVRDIPIQNDSRDYDFHPTYSNENAEDALDDKMKRYLDIMVEKLGKKLEGSTKRNLTDAPVASTVGPKQAFDSLVQVTPIQDRHSYSNAQRSDPVIPSPAWSDNSLDKPQRSTFKQNRIDGESSSKELLDLKQFLKGLPNGDQVLDAFERETRFENDPEDNPRAEVFEKRVSSNSTIPKQFSRNSSLSMRDPGTRKASITFQSTPITLEKQRSLSSNRRRSSQPFVQTKLKEPEAPRNTVSFAPDSHRTISSSSEVPTPRISSSRSQARTSSSTIRGSSPSAFGGTDAGLVKLLSHLTEKDTKIEELKVTLESTQRELEAAKKFIYKLKGSGKSIGPASMPDAQNQNGSNHSKLYKRLEMNDVDGLGNTQLQNLVKNILLVLGTPLSQLPDKLRVITEVLRQEHVYLQFANDLHYSLYSKEMDLQDPYGRDASVCLSDMISLIQQLDSERS